VDEEEVDAWVQTASILHSNGDAMDVAVKDGRIVGVRGRSMDRVNKGRVDPKDLFGWQANNSEDRLTKPLVRRDGELVEAGWDEAFDRIVRGGDRCRRARARPLGPPRQPEHPGRASTPSNRRRNPRRGTGASDSTPTRRRPCAASSTGPGRLGRRQD